MHRNCKHNNFYYNNLILYTFTRDINYVYREHHDNVIILDSCDNEVVVTTRQAPQPLAPQPLAQSPQPLPVTQQSLQPPKPQTSTSAIDVCSELDSLLIRFVSEYLSAKQFSAIYSFSGYDYNMSSICLSEGPTVQSILPMINDRFQCFPKLKVNVDFNDAWSDLVAIYKRRNFSVLCRIAITINDSAAIDAGGVRRQLYTTVFEDFASNRIIHLFEGEMNCLRSVVSAEARSSGFFKRLGKMVAHSICQEGIGFPYLSLTCYSYIIGGEELAMQQWSIEDLPSDSAILLEQVRYRHAYQLFIFIPVLLLDFYKEMFPCKVSTRKHVFMSGYLLVQ